jgi:CheY-like chemotaxis protein
MGGMAGMRVLVVEDDDLLREIICDQLREHGHVVLEAASAEDALDLCAAPAPDVLVADAGLPGIIDGYELALRGRVENPQMLVIYASGLAGPDLARMVPDAIFLRKPFRLAQLVQLIKERTGAGSKGRG